jgi:hypothetical protein
MFFTMTDSSRQAGRKKTRIFSKVGAQIRLGQHLSIFFSLSLLLNLLRENNRESLALAMCMQLSGVMSIIGDVHFREMNVGCALFKWFHLQWDHPRCGGSPSCRLDNAQHSLCWQLLLMILSSSSLAFFRLGPLYTRSQGWNRKRVFNLPQVLINAELCDLVLAPRLEKVYHQIWEANLQPLGPMFQHLLISWRQCSGIY